jgi:hypothetical protein
MEINLGEGCYSTAYHNRSQVVSQLMRKCRERNIFLPVIVAGQGDETFEGATVIEPEKGCVYDRRVGALIMLVQLLQSAHCHTGFCVTVSVHNDGSQSMLHDAHHFDRSASTVCVWEV